jgi:hypothetical protein
MPSTPAIDENPTTDTAPLPNRGHARRLIALYVFLALLAVIIGVAVGVHRHSAAAIESIAMPTEQSVIATAPPGVPSPTPLATRSPTPTRVPPTEPPPTLAPPTPIPPTAPAITAPIRPAPAVKGNQNDQHDNGNGNGRGKGKDKGD